MQNEELASKKKSYKVKDMKVGGTVPYSSFTVADRMILWLFVNRQSKKLPRQLSWLLWNHKYKVGRHLELFKISHSLRA